MREWPEFVAGQDYSVELKNRASDEVVSIRFINNGDEQFVSVKGSTNGTLFDKVLGRVIYALSAHSDNLMVEKVA